MYDYEDMDQKVTNVVSRKILLISIALIFIGLAALLLIYFVIPGIKQQTAPLSKTIRVLLPQQQMEKQVKLAFTAAQDNNIIDFINLAAKQQDKKLAYQFYTKAFNNMVVSYNKTKSPSQKNALLELKKYVSTLPGYKDNDFVIPK